MKIKSKIYAELLLESLSSVISTQADLSAGEKSYDKGGKLSLIAERFWNLLQKNKQYKDLPKILTELEQLYAEKNGSTIAYVESGEELSEKELEEIKKKLSYYCHFDSTKSVEKSSTKDLSTTARDDNKCEIILKVKINPTVTGLTAKIDNQVIDLSVEDKILRLRKRLSS